MLNKELLQQALDALESTATIVDSYYIERGKQYTPECDAAITALREALAAPAPAVPDLKHKPTVQRLMDLARKFRSAPGDLYDGPYKALQDACYAALTAAAGACA